MKFSIFNAKPSSQQPNTYICPMQYYIGQRVSYLHDSGEGKITAIVDKEHVEVDFGDDFPFEVHIDELIPVSADEDRYFRTREEREKLKTKEGGTVMGNLFELTLAVIPEVGDGGFRLYLLNPEGQDALYTCYIKRKHKYTGISNGKVPQGGREVLAEINEETLSATRAFYFQFIFYKHGTGYPQVPFSRELEWDHTAIQTLASYIPALDKKGWLFPLRALEENLPGEDKQFAEPAKKPRPVVVVDLHIEKLVSNPYALEKSLLLGIQLDHFEKSISDALMQHADKLVLIHGVGEGKLKSEIQKRLRGFPQVRSYGPADPKLYGNGATEILLK